jgi:arylsulfatase A-like enzyme/acetyl esterase/lipase
MITLPSLLSLRRTLPVLLSAFTCAAAAQWAYPPVMEGARPEIYKMVGDTKLSLYIFEPATPGTNRPAIVFFFGGGWQSGSPAQFEQQCRHFAARGMVAITADYRVGSRQQAKAADCVADAKSCVRWLRQHAAQLGINPQRIVAAGGSAGGHIAAATGTVPGLDQAGEDTSISAVPNALVLFNPALVLAPLGGLDLKGFGVNLDKERLGAEPAALSPAHHVKSGTPPTFIAHGKADTTVPFITAETFAAVMKHAGSYCELVGYEGQQHGFFNYGRGDNRYYRETLTAADAFLVSLGFLAPEPGSKATSAAAKPNVILILMDDLGYGDIGPFGSTNNRTPNLDRMAREGMKLTSFYAAPVCTPSRAQLLTGCYAKRVSLPNVLPPVAAVGLNPSEVTVAELLKSGGYATMCIGKWHVGDQPEFLPERQGFDHYFGLPYSNDMGGSETGVPAKADSQRANRPPLPLVRDGKVIETVSPAEQSRLTERYTDEALKFIRENRDKPFFLYLPHTAVHVPVHPGAQFNGKSANGAYGDWVEESDWSTGLILDTLRELKLAEKTLVIFTSDNGPWLTKGKDAGTAGPLRGGKGGTFEGGVREPTIAWWPGKIPAGSTCDAVVGNIDLLPTCAALAGVSLPAGVKIDGQSIAPLLLGQSKQSPHAAHFYFTGNRLEAVRSGPWKLAVAPQSESMGAAPKQPGFKPKLYHLDTDIGETTDVAAQHPEVVAQLQKLVAEMHADLGTNQQGQGVRPPGRVAKPVGLRIVAPPSSSVP